VEEEKHHIVSITTGQDGSYMLTFVLYEEFDEIKHERKNSAKGSLDDEDADGDARRNDAWGHEPKPGWKPRAYNMQHGIEKNPFDLGEALNNL
jgi:hypothetical protein